MIKPHEYRKELPVKLSDDALSSTTKVWDVLVASVAGDIHAVRRSVDECPQIAYAQYNYAPPIHFAVREGHADLVRYLLDLGAHDPDYKFYPFQESLQTVAADRGYEPIVELLDEYASDTSRQRYAGDTGEILYDRTDLEREFEKAVYDGEYVRVDEMLTDHPDLARDDTFFWGEGILLFAAKGYDLRMIDLLMRYGARVPSLLKWAQFYYFERLDTARYLMQKGMDPNTMSYQHVTLLHDMAQKGYVDKAELLIEYGAHLDAIDEAYQSTPLGLAARWGNIEMVEYLIARGADVSRSGASWATPLAWARSRGNEEVVEVLARAGAVG